MAEIRIQARAAAPVQTAWSVLAAQDGMGAWAPVRDVAAERQGDPPVTECERIAGQDGDRA